MKRPHSQQHSESRLDSYRHKARLSRRQRKIGRHAAAAAAAFSAVSLAGLEPLSADIVDSGINNMSASVTGSGYTNLEVDFNQDNQIDARFRLERYISGTSTYINAAFGKKKKKFVGGSTGIIRDGKNANLPAGFLVTNPPQSGYFASYVSDLAICEAGKKCKASKDVKSFLLGSGYTSGPDGFAGIGFNTTGGQTRFGWLKVRFDLISDPGGDLSLDEFKMTVISGYYDNSGNGIQVGQVIPEPNSLTMLGLLAMGSIGLRESRRRRRDRVKQSSTDDA